MNTCMPKPTTGGAEPPRRFSEVASETSMGLASSFTYELGMEDLMSLTSCVCK